LTARFRPLARKRDAVACVNGVRRHFCLRTSGGGAISGKAVFLNKRVRGAPAGRFRKLKRLSACRCFSRALLCTRTALPCRAPTCRQDKGRGLRLHESQRTYSKQLS
jgi:hypothetical protein